MALHPSLDELLTQAPHSRDAATARGMFAEAQQLARNAAEHGTLAADVCAWYASLTQALWSSAALAGAGTLTGPYARGEAVPGSIIDVLDRPEVGREVLGVEVQVVSGQPALIDAGSAPTSSADLLTAALAKRPPRLRTVGFLPDRDALVDIYADLLTPIADLARWGAGSEAGSIRGTDERLRTGALLNGDEADALLDAWNTALTLAMSQWLEHMPHRPTPLGGLSAMERTSYGAATRTVSAVIDSIAQRHKESR